MVNSWTYGTVSDGIIFAHSVTESSQPNRTEDAIYRLEDAISNIAEIHKNGFAEVKDEISSGFTMLADTLKWGFDNIAWELSQQTKVLNSIDFALNNPAITKAIEWRKIAENLRKVGNIDKSERFFLQALDEYPLDYRTYFGIALTCLEANKITKAMEYLEESLLYAPNIESFDYKSYSYRLMGHVEYSQENYTKAVEYLNRSIDYTPGYDYGYYDLARCLSKLKDAAGSLKTLKKAILINPQLFTTAENDEEFIDIRSSVTSLLKEIYLEEQNIVKQSLAKLKQLNNEAKEAWKRRNEYFFSESSSLYVNNYEQNIFPLNLSSDSCCLIVNKIYNQDKDFLNILEKAEILPEKVRVNSKFNILCYSVPVSDYIKCISEFTDNIAEKNVLSAGYTLLFEIDKRIKQMYVIPQIAIAASTLEIRYFPKHKTSAWLRLKGYPKETFHGVDWSPY
jgi:tetratricopeptide (TPR) repeat protein